MEEDAPPDQGPADPTEADGSGENSDGEGPALSADYVVAFSTAEGMEDDASPSQHATSFSSAIGACSATAAVESLGEKVERGFSALLAAFEREARVEGRREKVVDRLHAELQEYKSDLLLTAMRPVFIDLIQLHDDIGKVVSAPAQGVELGEARLIDLMLGLRQGLEDVLYRQGVEPFHGEGDLFDPRCQRAIATVPDDDPALAKTVAIRHRPGFRSGERVIRPEIVSVYALKKS